MIIAFPWFFYSSSALATKLHTFGFFRSSTYYSFTITHLLCKFPYCHTMYLSPFIHTFQSKTRSPGRTTIDTSVINKLNTQQGISSFAKSKTAMTRPRLHVSHSDLLHPKSSLILLFFLHSMDPMYLSRLLITRAVLCKEFFALSFSDAGGGCGIGDSSPVGTTCYCHPSLSGCHGVPHSLAGSACQLPADSRTCRKHCEMEQIAIFRQGSEWRLFGGSSVHETNFLSLFLSVVTFLLLFNFIDPGSDARIRRR